MRRELLYAQLVNMSSPPAVFAEISHISALMHGKIDMERLASVFNITCDLYNGQYPGYRKCNTLYHDLRHTTDVFLALARLLHGAQLDGITFSSMETTMALIATLMHDTGYIQESSDVEGTGGKYTLTHVARSIAFLKELLPGEGFSDEEISLCEYVVRGTAISEDPNRSAHQENSSVMLCKMIGTADLLGQLADRIYLEKLLFLYREFREAKLDGFSSELELLNSTIDFYSLMEKRLADDLSNVRNCMRSHFRVRWQIDRDLYQEAIEHNIEFLKSLLNQHGEDYRRELKREGIVQKLISMETEETAFAVNIKPTFACRNK